MTVLLSKLLLNLPSEVALTYFTFLSSNYLITISSFSVVQCVISI